MYSDYTRLPFEISAFFQKFPGSGKGRLEKVPEQKYIIPGAIFLSVKRTGESFGM